MKTYTLTAGTYRICDAACAVEEYYMEFLLPAFEDCGYGESIQAGSSVILGTGADGYYNVTNATTDELIDSFAVDAANVSIIPEKMINNTDGVVFTVTENTEVNCYHDAMVVGDMFRVRI